MSAQFDESIVGTVICNDNLKLISRLRAGTFGQIYLAVEGDKCNGDLEKEFKVSRPPGPCRLYAVKCLRKPFITYYDGSSIESELDLHRQVSSHENIVKLFCSSDDENYQYLIMEYASGGDLWSAIFDRRTFLGKDELLKTAFLDILSGVAHCHAVGVYHRDLKPENVLLFSDNGLLQAKICDFGSSTTDEMSMYFRFGTYEYSSPECYCYMGSRPSEPYNTRISDIWHLGMILFNMVSSYHPWAEPCIYNEKFEHYLENPDSQRPAGVTDEGWEVIKGAMKVNPLQRWALHDIRDKVLGTSKFFIESA